MSGLRDRYLNLVKMGDQLPAYESIHTPDSFALDELIKILPGDWSQRSIPPENQNEEPNIAQAPQEPTESQNVGGNLESAQKVSAEASPPFNRAALSMAVFGWNSVADGTSGLVSCKACFRRLGLWMYKPKENGDLTVYSSLDVASEHMEYCPWIDRVAQSGTGKPNEKPENLRCGWEAVAEAARVKHRRQIRSRGSMDTLRTELSTSPSTAPEGVQDDEKKKTADREWWAKIRRMRQVLTAKSPRQKSTAPK